MKVFLSAVTGQFLDCRNAVASDLRARGHEVVVQEDFRTQGRTLLEKLEDYIARCDCVIALVGDVYGWEPSKECRAADRPRRSYTQWEYFFALGERLNGRPVPPKHLWVYVANGQYLAKHAVSQSRTAASLQEEFIAGIHESDKDLATFGSCDELRWRVLRDVIPPDPLVVPSLVSNAEYQTFVHLQRVRKPGHWANAPPCFDPTLANAPVTHVSWEEAVQYCDWHSGRLPAEHDSRDLCESSRLVSTGDVLLEWYDMGTASAKEVREYGTGRPRGQFAPAQRRTDTGFRCLDVVDRTTHDWVSVEGGTHEVGVDAIAFESIRGSFHVSDHYARPIRQRGRRSLEIKPFDIAKTCVTNADFWKFIKVSGGPWPSHWQSKRGGKFDEPFPARLRYMPVVNITAEAAQQYCIWGRCRLPYWYEWEVAACGPSQRSYPWGDDFEAVRCNCRELGRGCLGNVDEFADGDSPAGCRQMCGNVFEWTVGQTGAFEVRGGSYQVDCRFWGRTFVYREEPAQAIAGDVGFRVVRQW